MYEVQQIHFLIDVVESTKDYDVVRFFYLTHTVNNKIVMFRAY